jgi:hypothetical protein
MCAFRIHFGSSSRLPSQLTWPVSPREELLPPPLGVAQREPECEPEWMAYRDEQPHPGEVPMPIFELAGGPSSWCPPPPEPPPEYQGVAAGNCLSFPKCVYQPHSGMRGYEANGFDMRFCCMRCKIQCLQGKKKGAYQHGEYCECKKIPPSPRKVHPPSMGHYVWVAK